MAHGQWYINRRTVLDGQAVEVILVTSAGREPIYVLYVDDRPAITVRWSDYDTLLILAEAMADDRDKRTVDRHTGRAHICTVQTPGPMTHRAECTCGWIGSNRDSDNLARAEWAGHTHLR